jgi:HB1, ASXL, restriction endonuclease HTH domain
VTYLEAALGVLKASQRPLTTPEILARILKEHLVSPKGKTPAATLSAALYRELGKHAELQRDAKFGHQRALRGSVTWSVGPVNKPR